MIVPENPYLPKQPYNPSFDILWISLLIVFLVTIFTTFLLLNYVISFIMTAVGYNNFSIKSFSKILDLIYYVQMPIFLYLIFFFLYSPSIFPNQHGFSEIWPVFSFIFIGVSFSIICGYYRQKYKKMLLQHKEKVENHD